MDRTTQPRAGAAVRAGRWAATALLAVAMVPMLARLTGIEVGPLAWLVAALPWFVMLALVAGVAALALRSWPTAAAASLPVILGLAWYAPLVTAEPSVQAEPALRVLTINLAFGEADAEQVVALVRQTQPDIVALQELTPDAVARLRLAGIDRLLPYAALEDRQGFTGVGLFSTVPIDNWDGIDGFTSEAIRAEVTVEGERVAVFCVHPMAPGIADHSRWAGDLDRLHAVLAGEELPALIAGDLNATTDHAGLRRLADAGYVDAPDQAGAGWRPTFPAGGWLPPLVAIDHVYARDLAWVATEVSTEPVPGTDHLALLVSFGDRPE